MAKEYLNAINNYPKFWNSVRENTLKSNGFSKELHYNNAKDKKLAIKKWLQNLK